MFWLQYSYCPLYYLGKIDLLFDIVFHCSHVISHGTIQSLIFLVMQPSLLLFWSQLIRAWLHPGLIIELNAPQLNCIHLLFSSSIDSVSVNAENQTILLYPAIDDDHDDHRDDEEEQEDDVDGCMSLSRSLWQLCLDLSPSIGLEVTEIHSGVAGQVRPWHHTASEKYINDLTSHDLRKCQH